jgi:hypothetical protein
MLSWAFIPFRVFLFPVIELLLSSSSHELTYAQLAVLFVGVLQSITRRKSWLNSLEFADPPGVFRLSLFAFFSISLVGS